MNAKQLWISDIEWCGQPETWNRDNSKSFNFIKNNAVTHIWYIHSGNILCRLPMDMHEKEYNWILTPSQIKSFYDDWHRIDDAYQKYIKR